MLEAPDDPLDRARQVLEEIFGLGEFRPWQLDALRALFHGTGRVLVVAPTGGGKSLTYQLPATLLPGTTLVISPLVALMEDQVRSLAARGIAATFLASTLELEERRRREDALVRGEYKLVFVAPERLASGVFVARLARANIDLVAVDEAHCIAQWGHDFRPDYLRIGELLRLLEPPRILACTATATPQVRREIALHLGMTDRGYDEILRGFARPNLHLQAHTVLGPREARTLVLAELARSLGSPGAPRGAAIVYAATRKATETWTEALREKGYSAGTYHAGMDGEARTRIASAFAARELDVVVATNAFGMGIDRPDIRAVIHAQPPASIEAYYQEVGRAGRDGAEAHGLLLCSGADIALRRRLCASDGAGGETDAEAAARAWMQFRALLTYLDAGTCRHDFILRHFGDEGEVLGGCGHCDICRRLSGEGQGAAGDDETISLFVRKALSGVARAKQRGGLLAVAAMLVGRSDPRVVRFGFDQLSTFALLKDEREDWVLALLRMLLAAGWIDLTPTEHPVPFVTREGWLILKSVEPVRALLPPRERPRASGSPKPRAADAADAAGLEGEERGLFARLREHRAQLAKKRGVPAYVIAQDRTLADLARKKPSSHAELGTIFGFGPSRIEAYGDSFLGVISGT